MAKTNQQCNVKDLPDQQSLRYVVDRRKKGWKVLNLEGLVLSVPGYASTNHIGISQKDHALAVFAVFTTVSPFGKMATPADTQAKPVMHPTSSPTKADKQTSEGRESPHPTDTPVIRREAVIRAASAQGGSSTPRGQSPLTLVSATAGSGSRTASPITHLEEARGERRVPVTLFYCLPLCSFLTISVTYVSYLFSSSFGQLVGGQVHRVDDGGGRNGARSQASLHWEQG